MIFSDRDLMGIDLRLLELDVRCHAHLYCPKSRGLLRIVLCTKIIICASSWPNPSSVPRSRWNLSSCLYGVGPFIKEILRNLDK
jgi:hypothetical protein